jgi:hypothetical protein
MESVLGLRQLLQCFSKFKIGVTSAEDVKQVGHPSTSKT